VAASATVGLVDREGEIIRMTLIPMFYYIVQGGFLGLAILAGGLNLWWIAVLIWPATVLFLMSRNRGAVPATQKR
jgi:lactate permease